MTSKMLVHVIDDDQAVRESLAFMLETADFEVRTYESANRFIEAHPAPVSGCVITDVRMPGISGVELIRALRTRGADLPVVVITGHGDVPLAVEAMREGAIDFIEKPFSDEKILHSLGLAAKLNCDQQALQHERQVLAERLANLSKREREVLDGLVAGQANKAIAQELNISPRTVEVYRANMMFKMKAKSLSELVRMVVTADPHR